MIVPFNHSPCTQAYMHSYFKVKIELFGRNTCIISMTDKKYQTDSSKHLTLCFKVSGLSEATVMDNIGTIA